MKILFLIIFLISGAPCFAEERADNIQTSDSSTSVYQDPAGNEYSCKYYAVKLPPDWKAIVPPEDSQGLINAVFATDMGGSIVTILAGPSGGRDAQSLADIFAQQYKASSPPVFDNGSYTFQFPVKDTMAMARVTSYDGVFMLTYIAGDLAQGQKFLQENVRSDSWPGLLPK